MADSQEVSKPRELHQLWEDASQIRERLRSEKQLLVWAKPSMVGVPCMENIALNFKVLTVLADFYCPTTEKVKPPKIGLLRPQVGLSNGYMLTKNWSGLIFFKDLGWMY